MLLIGDCINTILPIVRYELYRLDSCFLIKTKALSNVLLISKTHFNHQYHILTCISGVDYPENLHRFQVIYELLSIRFNSRLRLRVFVDELTPLTSIENVFSAASWWECEIWDMFGVFFKNQVNLTRLLTDYGFEGYPLRKDFPLTGFVESRYHVIKNRVVSESIEVSQEYREFEFISPWENLIKNEKVIS